MNIPEVSEKTLLLQDACFYYAKEIIASKQNLIPFGAFLSSNNEIIIEDPSHKSDLHKNRIEYLSHKLKRLSSKGKINTWIICFDGVLNKKELENKDAICIEIHNKNENHVTNLYYPYEWNKNEIKFTSPISIKE